MAVNEKIIKYQKLNTKLTEIRKQLKKIEEEIKETISKKYLTLEISIFESYTKFSFRRDYEPVVEIFFNYATYEDFKQCLSIIDQILSMKNEIIIISKGATYIKLICGRSTAIKIIEMLKKYENKISIPIYDEKKLMEIEEMLDSTYIRSLIVTQETLTKLESETIMEIEKLKQELLNILRYEIIVTEKDYVISSTCDYVSSIEIRNIKSDRSIAILFLGFNLTKIKQVINQILEILKPFKYDKFYERRIYRVSEDILKKFFKK